MGTASFAGAAGAVVDLVERIPPSAWGRPALGEWDLRALVGHTARALTTKLDYIGRPAAREDVDSPARYFALAVAAGDPAAVAERGRRAGAELGADPAAAFRDLLARVRTAVAATAPETLVTTPLGGMRLAAYVPTRTFELVVHGLDVAAATGLAVEFDAAVLDEVAALAARIAVARGEGPRLLAALTGRAALPAGWSVVGR